jgi:hypothetical protein
VGADVILTAVVLALVALVCAAGIGVTWWALFGDKARGRRRCPRCWHDLSGTPGRTCGECGFEAIDEPELFATRRRWPIAVSSVAFILAVAGWVRLTVLDGRWSSYVPDAALGVIVSVTPGESLPAWTLQEVAGRAAIGTLGAERTASMLESLAGTGVPIPATDPRARTISALAGCDPVEFAVTADDPQAVAAARTEARRAFEARRATALAAMPTWLAVRTPAAWPRGEPVSASAWIWAPGRGAEWRVRVSGGDGTWLAGQSARWSDWVDRAFLLTLPPPDADGRLATRIEVETRHPDEAGALGPWRTDGAVEVVRTLAPLDAGRPVPVDGGALREQAARAFSLPVTAWADDERPVTFAFDPRIADDAESKDGPLLMGVAVELLEGDAVRRRVEFWWSGDRRTIGSEIVLEDLPALRRLRDRLRTGAAARDTPADTPRPTDDDAVRPLEEWTLRTTGLREVAMRNPGTWTAYPGARYWAGRVEAPAEGGFRDERAPLRRSWRMPPGDSAPRP